MNKPLRTVPKKRVLQRAAAIIEHPSCIQCSNDLDVDDKHDDVFSGADETMSNETGSPSAVDLVEIVAPVPPRVTRSSQASIPSAIMDAFRIMYPAKRYQHLHLWANFQNRQVVFSTLMTPDNIDRMLRVAKDIEQLDLLRSRYGVVRNVYTASELESFQELTKHFTRPAIEISGQVIEEVIRVDPTNDVDDDNTPRSTEFLLKLFCFEALLVIPLTIHSERIFGVCDVPLDMHGHAKLSTFHDSPCQQPHMHWLG